MNTPPSQNKFPAAAGNTFTRNPDFLAAGDFFLDPPKLANVWSARFCMAIA
eukprot:NODE_8078_length_373_cov_20.169753_g6348_i0.p2 GENE.NODE_8078_length_373_cov_20.169753_g6348_i0~~NODE_8078_length_373_cov_20.169753_g6348_i0.p2  ORF type:complete len:51 (-),score=2.23 NODE_8078_length_373_cov_20.169753_g6348_i0:90-242(-)